MTSDDPNTEISEKFITRLQGAKAKAEDVARLQLAEAGLDVGNGNSHKSLLHSAEMSAAERRKRKSDPSSSGIWLDILQAQIADMQRVIDRTEDGFENFYGEDWREQFAMRILDPDVMPQRRDGESMDDYRASVEDALINELLNPDGTIKDEYKDHPEYGKLAQWAQWKHDQQQAKALQADLNDPSLSESERIEKMENFTQSASHDRIEQALRGNSLNNQSRGDLKAARDGAEDSKGDMEPTTVESAFLP